MTEGNYNARANDIGRVLVSENEIDQIVSRLAAQIDADVEGSERKLLLVCVLKGSMIFTSDLMRKIKTPLELDLIKASSYGGGTVSSGELKISLNCSDHDWKNTNVLIVEDIIDSGNTLSRLVKYFRDKGAEYVKTCSLLDKPERREVEFECDFVGKRVPNEFVVGYGLDADESYRELPFIGVLKDEIIQKYII